MGVHMCACVSDFSDFWCALSSLDWLLDNLSAEKALDFHCPVSISVKDLGAVVLPRKLTL